MVTEELILTYGGEVKALKDGKVGGYLVRYSDENSPDLAGDYFTKDTDFDIEFPGKSTVYYNHGQDKKLALKKLGGKSYKADLTQDDVGVWVEAQLDLRDDYERAIYQMAKSGKLGWSSGTASHVVERENGKKANHITRWGLGLDASLTPIPAEPKNVAISIKSFEAPGGLEEFVEQKSVLGEYVEQAALGGAIERLWWALVGKMYSACENKDREMMDACFADFHRIGMKLYDVLMSDEEMQEEMKSLAALAQTQDFNDGRIGRTYNTQITSCIESMKYIVVRGEAIAAKSDGVFTEKNKKGLDELREQAKNLTVSIDTLLKTETTEQPVKDDDMDLLLHSESILLLTDELFTERN